MRDDSWRLYRAVALSLLALLALCAICSAQITIEGPSRVDVGREIVLDVRGTPEPDDDAQWGKAFAWLKDLSLDLDSPEGASATIKAGFVLDVNLETGTVYPRLQARAIPDEPGIYFVSVVYWPDRSRAVHRITVGPSAPRPPDPIPPPSPHPNPYPEPSASLKQAVQPLRDVSIPAADAVKLAAMFSKISGQIDIGTVANLEDLNRAQAAAGQELGVQRTEALGDAIDAAYEAAVAKPGTPNRSLTMDDVKAFRAMAWAIWRGN
jgi:hypothetical protein